MNYEIPTFDSLSDYALKQLIKKGTKLRNIKSADGGYGDISPIYGLRIYLQTGEFLKHVNEEVDKRAYEKIMEKMKNLEIKKPVEADTDEEAGRAVLNSDKMHSTNNGYTTEAAAVSNMQHTSSTTDASRSTHEAQTVSENGSSCAEIGRLRKPTTPATASQNRTAPQIAISNNNTKQPVDCELKLEAVHNVWPNRLRSRKPKTN